MTELYHYGTKRHSGRYPWGSGKNPYQGEGNFNIYVSDMRSKGMTDVEIAKLNGMNTTALRNKISLGKAQQMAENQATALRMKERGYSNTEIARRMGTNESNVRNYLNPSLQQRQQVMNTITDTLRSSVNEKGFIDIGVGSENYLGISRTKLQTAVSKLKDEGYTVHQVQIEQPFSPGKYTNVLTLAGPGVTIKDVYQNKDKISTIGKYSEDLGKTFLGIEKPRSVSSDRIEVAFAEDGGSKKDGIIELRRGVEDLQMAKRYSQVRIAVDDSHYLKGVAIYSDDLPKGIDIRFNTNKSKKDTDKMGAMKELHDSIDSDNPFKSTVRQTHYIDKNGKEQLSALNIVGSKEGSGEEGSWGQWSKNLSSQVLSKQPVPLAKKQLGIAYDVRKNEFDDIMKLTNPAVKKKLLESFADDADSAAVHLKAAALPRQNSQLILPIPSIPEGQVYAPNYNPGERVVLIRHPHGGRFEIPELTVNNKNPQAKKIIGNAEDAIGINPKTAERLSGADFDGDTVIVIPNNNKTIKTAAPLKELEGFDPKISYKGYPGMKVMSENYKQTQMGEVSNLITDMTIRGASQSEIARAVRHSMTVIDAVKHKLNYKLSYEQNGISELKAKYQNSARGRASTLISRAKGQKRVPMRKEGAIVDGKRLYIDPKTGKKLYTNTNESYVNKNGKVIIRTTKFTKMAETDNAFKLSSGSPMENVYAEHANKLKALANKARKETLNIKSTPVSISAKGVYAQEIDSLNRKLSLALQNKPLETQAQIQTNVIVSRKKQDNPNMDSDDLKKIKTQALAASRARVGAKKQAIDITPREWEAIQAGAISNNKLTQILNNVKDLDQVKQYATPREAKPTMNSAKISRAKALLANGYTQAEVASMLGVSVSTINNSIK